MMTFMVWMYIVIFFFFKQKTAYEMRISDWSSDVGSSDLSKPKARPTTSRAIATRRRGFASGAARRSTPPTSKRSVHGSTGPTPAFRPDASPLPFALSLSKGRSRSEEHTSELPSLMRSSYAVFCLKKKNTAHDVSSLTNHGLYTQGRHTRRARDAPRH